MDGAPPPPELLWRKHLALLVYLARSPRRGRARDHLAGLLWGDREETVARHSLREAIRVLRKVLGDTGLETSGDQVRIVGDTLELDTDRFEAAMARGEWETAAGLAQGELMEGFGVPDASGFEDWLTAERSHWRQRCTDALTRAARARMANGDPLGATTLAVRAVAGDPGASGAVYVAMQAQALLGDRASALATHARFLALVGSSEGSRAGEELAELAARVRQGRQWHLPTADGAAVKARPQLHLAPLVGAGSVLAAMVHQWELTRDRGRGRTVLLGGPPGHGKSRTSEELCARAALDGARVIRIRAVPGDRDEAWSAILGLARGGLLDAPAVPAADPGALAAFAARLPEWADRYRDTVRHTTPIGLGPAFLELLRVTTSEGPLLVAIDDADWLDDSSFRALETAMRDLAAAPLLILLCWGGLPRGAPIDDVRVRIGREVEGAALSLGALDDAALRTLVHWALPRFTDGDVKRVARRVAVDSAGIPLLAVELIRAIALGLELEGAPATWPMRRQTLDQTLPGELPDVLVAAIRVGVRALSQEAQSALIATAVLGDRVPAGTIGRGSGLAAPALALALDELEWQRWLVAESRGYSFVARIVREVVVRDLVPAGQQQRIIEAAAASRI